ncbi:MAG: YchF/TatD family DNA exonuclease [Candidatus Saelkia tenebricola]|nr:YchF/TatD family DNA exonuclease [Candidatus Saelkia tenebricola]
MYLIDTHCHLWHPEFHSDLKNVLKSSRNSGVDYFINIGVDVKTSKEAVKMAKKNKGIFAGVGYHPHYAKDFRESDGSQLKKLLSARRVVAFGEVGLDFYRQISNKKTQIMVLDELLSIWCNTKLPIVVHNRDAHNEILSVLNNIRKFNPKIVMHCFSGDKNFLRECLNRGYYISYATNLTFNKELKELIKYTPLEKLLLETDSPYLSPQTKRGIRNEPLNIKESIAVAVAIKGVGEEDIVRSLALNAKVVFNVGHVSINPRIVYKYKGGLYINLTNECSNECVFCTIGKGDYFAGYNLRLNASASIREVLKAVSKEKGYQEVSFCGFGEPFCRFKEMTKIARILKMRGYEIRVVTNGCGNLIQGKNVLPLLKGIVDKISVSLNVVEKDKYNVICKPKLEGDVFSEILNFIREAKKYIPQVEITFLNFSDLDLQKCKEIAQSLEVDYKIREYNITKNTD